MIFDITPWQAFTPDRNKETNVNVYLATNLKGETQYFAITINSLVFSDDIWKIKRIFYFTDKVMDC
jgi:hypothetical protein